MFLMIGFGLFMAPVLGIALYGIVRLIQTIGRTATVGFCISLPFYFVTVFTLMEKIMQEFENIMNHTTNNVWQFSAFEWFSIGCLALLLIISSIFARIHLKKWEKSNNGHGA